MWTKKIIMAILTIVCAMSLTFVVIRTMPGDPVQTMAMNLVNTQQLEYTEAYNRSKILLNFDPDKSVMEQYMEFIGGLMQGNLGVSMMNKIPVIEIIAGALPWTLFVLSISIFVSFIIGILIGMYTAYRRKSKVDTAVSIYACVSGSLPDYIVGMLLVLFFATRMRIFPNGGAYSAYVIPGFNLDYIVDVLYHACLPTITYVVTGIGGWALMMKGSAISVLGEDYITAAKARGLSERTIRQKYVGKNAMLPLVTGVTLTFGALVGGSPLVENLFSYPGMGYYMGQAVGTRDFPLMQGLFLLITISVVMANLVADIIYRFLDPRIREGGKK